MSKNLDLIASIGLGVSSSVVNEIPAVITKDSNGNIVIETNITDTVQCFSINSYGDFASVMKGSIDQTGVLTVSQ